MRSEQILIRRGELRNVSNNQSRQDLRSLERGIEFSFYILNLQRPELTSQ